MHLMLIYKRKEPRNATAMYKCKELSGKCKEPKVAPLL